MSDNILYTVLVLCLTLLLGALGLGIYRYNVDKEQHGHDLRMRYLEKCKITPDQLEKLYPNDGTPAP